MDIEQMKDFNSEIIDEVNTYAENEKLTSLEAFTKIFLSIWLMQVKHERLMQKY